MAETQPDLTVNGDVADRGERFRTEDEIARDRT